MNYAHITLCFSLPRSRSQWLAWLYGHAAMSWHDPLKTCEHPLDLKRMIDEQVTMQRPLFIADTAAILFHHAITESLPGATFLYVVRPLDEVMQSIYKQGVTPGMELAAMLSYMHAKLLTASRAAPIEHRCEYREVDDTAKRWWPIATKRQSEVAYANFFAQANGTVIDVPLRDQANFPDKTRRLLAHAE